MLTERTCPLRVLDPSHQGARGDTAVVHTEDDLAGSCPPLTGSRHKCERRLERSEPSAAPPTQATCVQEFWAVSCPQTSHLVLQEPLGERLLVHMDHPHESTRAGRVPARPRDRIGAVLGASGRHRRGPRPGGQQRRDAAQVNAATHLAPEESCAFVRGQSGFGSHALS